MSLPHKVTTKNEKKKHNCINVRKKMANVRHYWHLLFYVGLEAQVAVIHQKSVVFVNYF